MTSGFWNPGFQDSRKALELATFDWFQYIWYISHSILVKELDFQCRILKLLHSWKLPEISWNSGYWPGIGQFWLISIYRVYFPLNSSQETWFSMQNLKITSFLETSRNFLELWILPWKLPGIMYFSNSALKIKFLD